jgi:uncharacterized repeat protein (TIGR01451 family)
MLKHPRIAFIASLAALALLCVVLSAVSPVRVSITLVRDEQPAAAMPRPDITATAPPARPTSTAQPTFAPPTPAPPTPTSAPTRPPATATAAPPTAQPRPTEAPRRTTGEPRPQPSDPTAPAQPAEPTQPPNIVIVKTADQSIVKRGDKLVFTLEARNTGAAAVRDVVVTDVVPDAFEVIDLSSSRGDIVVDGQTVTAYPATLAPGESAIVRVTARVRAGAADGQQRNTALVTTSTPGDDPGDNTSTAIVTVEPPQRAVPANPAPPRLPRTADPEAPTFMLLWGPWLMFGFMIGLFGLMVRFGMLRTRFVTVRMTPAHSRAAIAPSLDVPARAAVVAEGIELDAADLVRRWRAGASVGALTSAIAADNPAANTLVIALAVQQIIDEHLRGK